MRAAKNGGIALGTERFQREVAAMLGRWTWRGRPAKPRTQEPEAGQIRLSNLRQKMLSGPVYSHPPTQRRHWNDEQQR